MLLLGESVTKPREETGSNCSLRRRVSERCIYRVSLFQMGPKGAKPVLLVYEAVPGRS